MLVSHQAASPVHAQLGYCNTDHLTCWLLPVVEKYLGYFVMQTQHPFYSALSFSTINLQQPPLRPILTQKLFKNMHSDQKITSGAVIPYCDITDNASVI